MMRTQEEIVAYLRSRPQQIFDFVPEVLIPYLDFAHAKEWLKAEVTAESWAESLPERTMAGIKADLGRYLPFAWEKALDHRGLSASRSVSKMKGFLWLLGDDALLAFAEADRNYPQYGAPILHAICLKYGFPVPEGAAVERMAKGEPCSPRCEDGCGR